MTDRELMQQALEALEDAHAHMEYYQDEKTRERAITALRERLAQPQRTHWEGCEEVHPECRKQRREWVGLTEDEWKELWEKFNDGQDGLEEEFQERMTVKHGKGYYLINPEESWKSQQELIQRLVEAKLREKNA